MIKETLKQGKEKNNLKVKYIISAIKQLFNLKAIMTIMALHYYSLNNKMTLKAFTVLLYYNTTDSMGCIMLSVTSTIINMDMPKTF